MPVRLRNVFIFIFTSLMFLCGSVSSATSSLNYHGRIVKPNGQAFESNSVTLKLQIRSTGAEDCLMWEETYSGQDMTGTGGVFSLNLNAGTGTRTDGSGLTFAQVFGNYPTTTMTVPLANCTGGSNTITLTSSSHRVARLLFKDSLMATFEQTPDMALAYVPFSMDSQKVGGFTPQNLLRVEDASGPQAAAAFTPVEFAELQALIGGSSGQYEKSGELNGQTIPALSNGNVLQWQGGAWTAVTPVTSESDPNTRAYAKADLPTCAANEFLQSTGANTWVCTGVTGAAGGTVTSITVGSGLVDGSNNTGTNILTTGTIALPDLVTAGTATKVTFDAKGRITASASLAEADIPTLSTAGKVSGSAITSGTIAGSTAVNTSGNITAGAISGSTLVLRDADTNTITLQSPADINPSYTLTLPTTDGTSGEVLTTDGNGVLSWGAVASATGVAAADGTAAAPSMSFGSDPDTGWFRPAADTLAAATGGTERVRIDSSGKVGMGTTNPTERLHIKVPSGAAGGIFIEHPDYTSDMKIIARGGPGGANIVDSPVESMMISAGGDPTTHFLSFGTNNKTERMRISADGKVGIGTDAPAAALHVNKTAPVGTITTAGVAVTGTGTNFTTALSVGDRISTKGTIRTIAAIADDTNLTVDSAFSPDISSAASYARIGIILDTGNVGIGTTNAGYALNVLSDTLNTYASSSTTLQAPEGSVVRFENKYNGTGSYSGIELLTRRSDGVSQKGFIGVVSTSSGRTPDMVIGQQTNGAQYAERIRILTSGNVGIGTDAPNTKLDVSGAITSRPYGTATGATGQLIMQELAANGTDTATIRVPDALAASYTLTLPTTDGASGEVLTTDGNGVLSWIPAGSATSLAAGAGTATAPSMSFSGDPNTGFYNTAADQIGVAANGAQIFNFSSSGLKASTNGGATITTANGTAAAPTFSFTGDEDTGWFSPAANTLAAATAGSERVRIDSTGNVGIGTTNPNAKLDVATGSSGGAIIGNWGGVTPTDIAQRTLLLGPRPDSGSYSNLGFQLSANEKGSFTYSATDLTWDNYTGGSWHNRFTILNSNGNVGLGTNNPSAALHTIKTSEQLRLGYDDTNYSSFTVNSNGNLTVAPSGGKTLFAGGINAAYGFPVQIGGAGLFTTYINLAGSSGNTTSPEGVIDYIDTGLTRVSITPSVGLGGPDSAHPSFMARTNNSAVVGTSIAGYGQVNSSTFEVRSDGTRSKLSIYDLNVTGDVQLTFGNDVYGSGGSATDLYSIGVDVSDSNKLKFSGSGTLGTSDFMTVTTSGLVGIGTSSPTTSLDIYKNTNADHGITFRNESNGSGASAKITLGNDSDPLDGWIQLNSSTNTTQGGARSLNILANAGDISFSTQRTSPQIRMTIKNGGNVGVGTTIPAAKLDVAGEVKFGNTSSTCNATNEGQQRYNSVSKKMEFCNATAWTEYGTGSGGSTPAGLVVASAAACPTGYLATNGAAVSRTTYAALFTAISTTYGAGDGSTTFNLPDYRGYFLRGTDGGTARDPDAASRTDRGDGTTGDSVGTVQAGAYAAHNHGVTDPGHNHTATGGVYFGAGGAYGGFTAGANPLAGIDISSQTTGVSIQNSGGNETRPKNINVNYCISTGS